MSSEEEVRQGQSKRKDGFQGLSHRLEEKRIPGRQKDNFKGMEV